MRRTAAALFAVAALGGAFAATTAQASTSATVPPACVKVPLTGGLQLQVGYCPNG
jgi:hypothetical protein